MTVKRSLVTLGLLSTLTLAMTATAALKVGANAPEFSAPAYLAGNAFTFKLADALEKGPVVVYFFPAAHTPGCNLEASLFSQAIDKFKARNATVIGVTAGNTDELADFSKEVEHCGGKFAVAADRGAKIAKQYDALLKGKPEWSDRTSYVIAPSGKIVHVFSAMNPSQHVKQTLEAVEGLAKQ